MEPIQLWQAKWSHGLYVPMYLFLGGLTSGVYVVAVLADWLGIKWSRADMVSKVATYTSLVALGLSGFFLTVHLGKPERGLAFPIFFTNFDSWITRGGWIVGISTIFVGLYVVLRYFGIVSWLRRLVGTIGLPVVTMLAVYTGLLLSHAGFVPLWSKQFLPVLFLNSGMTTGLAAVGLIFLIAWPFLQGSEGDPRYVVRWMSLAVVVLILLEGYELYQFMTSLGRIGKRAASAIRAICGAKRGCAGLCLCDARRTGAVVLVGHYWRGVGHSAVVDIGGIHRIALGARGRGC